MIAAKSDPVEKCGRVAKDDPFANKARIYTYLNCIIPLEVPHDEQSSIS